MREVLVSPLTFAGVCVSLRLFYSDRGEENADNKCGSLCNKGTVLLFPSPCFVYEHECKWTETKGPSPFFYEVKHVNNRQQD